MNLVKEFGAGECAGLVIANFYLLEKLFALAAQGLLTRCALVAFHGPKLVDFHGFSLRFFVVALEVEERARENQLVVKVILELLAAVLQRLLVFASTDIGPGIFDAWHIALVECLNILIGHVH